MAFALLSSIVSVISDEIFDQRNALVTDYLLITGVLPVDGPECDRFHVDKLHGRNSVAG